MCSNRLCPNSSRSCRNRLYRKRSKLYPKFNPQHSNSLWRNLNL